MPGPLERAGPIHLAGTKPAANAATKHTYDLGLIGNCAFLGLIKLDTSNFI